MLALCVLWCCVQPAWGVNEELSAAAEQWEPHFPSQHSETGCRFKPGCASYPRCFQKEVSSKGLPWRESMQKDSPQPLPAPCPSEGLPSSPTHWLSKGGSHLDSCPGVVLRVGGEAAAGGPACG